MTDIKLQLAVTYCKVCKCETNHQVFCDVNISYKEKGSEKVPVLTTWGNGIQCLSCGRYLDLESKIDKADIVVKESTNNIVITTGELLSNQIVDIDGDGFTATFSEDAFLEVLKCSLGSTKLSDDIVTLVKCVIKGIDRNREMIGGGGG